MEVVDRCDLPSGGRCHFLTLVVLGGFVQWMDVQVKMVEKGIAVREPLHYAAGPIRSEPM
jgi:hypothetical protein